MARIVHICVPEKFIPPLLRLIRENFPREEHAFLIGGRRLNPKYIIDTHESINCIGILPKMRQLPKLYRAEKIFLHGLYESQFLYLLAIQPWLLKKCVWRPWGDDLYQYENKRVRLKSILKELIRAFVIRRLGHVAHYIPGEYSRIQRWYQTKAKFHECIGYLSNTVTPRTVSEKTSGSLVIQVGNSAFPRNAHLDAINRIAAFVSKDIKVIAPLSYGPREEAQRVAAHGAARLGNKFTALFDFIPLERYLSLLDDVDIGFFNQDRQQAMGNMITLLGMGKTLYLRRSTSSWELFKKLDLTVFDAEEFDLQLISKDEQRKNMDIIAQHFSRRRLLEQYEAIFNC